MLPKYNIEYGNGEFVINPGNNKVTQEDLRWDYLVTQDIADPENKFKIVGWKSKSLGIGDIFINDPA